MNAYSIKVKQLFDTQENLLTRKNEPAEKTNGCITDIKIPYLQQSIFL